MEKILRLTQISQDMFCGICITIFEDLENNVVAGRITNEFVTTSSWIKFKDCKFEHEICSSTEEFCKKHGFINGGVINAT